MLLLQRKWSLKWNCPRYLADKKDGKVNKGIFDIHVIDVYFTSVRSSPWVFDTGSVARISNSKQELQNKWRLVEGEVMMCVGSGFKIDMIIIALHIVSGLVLNLNKCYLVFALNLHKIGSCLLQYSYSFKIKNNCYSVYMNKTFYGHTLNVNGLLNLDRSDSHIHNIDAKRCKVDNDS